MNFHIKRWPLWTPEILGALICIGLGMISGWIGHSANSPWYLALHKSSLTPPSWIFPPVWTTLYGLMGITLGKIWKKRHVSRLPLILFGGQFALNFLWSPIFFGCHRIDWALVILMGLWVTLLALTVSVRRSRENVLLLIPYMIWVSFALFLNFRLYQLNSFSS